MIFSAIQTALFFAWMPHTRGTASYSFTEGGDDAKAPAQAAFAGSGGSAYQEVGASTSL